MGGQPQAPRQTAVDTQAAAARARAIVMEIERGLGFEPTDREFEKLGYDIESAIPGTGKLRFIEVKGRVAGADTITVTRNEILYSLNKPDDFILAMVEFGADGSHEVRYLRRPFHEKGVTTDFAGATVNFPFANCSPKRLRPHENQHDREDTKETHRSRAAAGGDQQGVGAREVDPARASEHAAPVVGAAAAGGGAGGDLRADGGRPVGLSGPVPDREGAGEGARSGCSASSKTWCKWENTTNETVLQEARDEIWQSWRRACAENADHPRAKELFDRHKLPAFHDPFAGGGALPLEAQRLGLESYASDLNPVAVLINKAMIEIPPKFAGKPPVNPEWHGRSSHGEQADGTGRRAGPGRGRALLRPVDARRGREAHRPPLPQGRSHGRNGEGAAGPEAVSSARSSP